MTAQSMPTGKSRLITPYRIVVSVLMAAAIAAIYIGFVSSKDPEPSISRPSRVLTFEPGEGATALRQSRIFVQLQPGFVGVLLINGVEIPEDQLDHLEGANSVGYLPRPGTETGSLEPGENCATVVFWEPEIGRSNAESFRWCWQVH